MRLRKFICFSFVLVFSSLSMAMTCTSLLARPSEYIVADFIKGSLIQQCFGNYRLVDQRAVFYDVDGAKTVTTDFDSKEGKVLFISSSNGLEDLSFRFLGKRFEDIGEEDMSIFKKEVFQPMIIDENLKQSVVASSQDSRSLTISVEQSDYGNENNYKNSSLEYTFVKVSDERVHLTVVEKTEDTFEGDRYSYEVVRSFELLAASDEEKAKISKLAMPEGVTVH